MQELIGKELGQYRIEAKIGEGGMASVFKAYQPSLERYVAIKVLMPAFAAKDPSFVTRFQREAKLVARLHHPHILPVYDFGTDGDYSYIVMHHVAGAETLEKIIALPVTQERIFELINQVAQALAYTHQQGVIHRDVKPSNVLLDNGWALLSDFGLIKIEEAATRLTKTGLAIGTPAYISPEQAQGNPIDHRADIFSLGVILYEMLTGRIPHEAPTSLGIMLKRIVQPPCPPRTLNPAISESVEQVVLRALATDPQDRYNSTTDFVAALKQAMADGAYREPPIAGVLNNNTALFDTPPPTTAPTPFDSAPPHRPDSTLMMKSSSRRRRPIWSIMAGLGLTVTVLLWWGSNAFSSVRPQASPTQVVAVAPAPTHTPTLTPPQPPPHTATPSLTPDPPTATPSATPAPATAPSTATSLPPASTPTETPLPAPVLPAAPPTATATPMTAAVPNSEITLLNPVTLAGPSYGPTTFEWEWHGNLPPEYGFEVRVWREGEAPAGVHNAVEDNQLGRIERIGAHRYRLHVNIRDAAGVQGRSGDYLWTVAVVQIQPDYTDLGQQAPPAHLRFEAGGGGGNGGGNNGDGGGIS